MPNYASSNYLIYKCFETQSSDSSSKICGSLLLNGANTIEEAEAKLASYRAQQEHFDKIHPLSKSSSRYMYISNKSEWWKI